MNNGSYRSRFTFVWYASWRMLLRDWRGGELRVLAAGLLIAVTSITAVGFFTDRIERGLQQQSAELIAADLVIASAERNVTDYIEDARAMNLRVAVTQSFRSIVLGNERPQLVEVKAVSAGYPLRGALRVSDTAFGSDEAVTRIPEAGEIWVEARLLQILGLETGDAVSLGRSTFQIGKVLRYEPDRAGDMFSVAPRILMNRLDVDATGLITTGSLVSYRVLVAGPVEDVASYRNDLETRLRQGEQILTVAEGRPELHTALQRAQQFLGLAALISVLLAGVAVATVAYRYASRHLDTSAMLRCLGAPQKTIIRLFFLEMLWLSLLASSIGCVLGLLTQFVISGLLDQIVLTRLPTPSMKPVLLGYATGFVMLTGFALPPLMSLARVPPLRVLRRDIVSKPVSAWIVYCAVALCMAVLLYWQVGDIRLVANLLGGITVTVLVLALAAYGLIRILGSMRSRAGIIWRFGLANISRRPGSSVIQIVAFGLGIMVLLLLLTIRTDLIDDWQRSLPQDAPNHFVINVQPDQVARVQSFFNDIGVANTRLYPMVRARLLEINGVPAMTSDYESERAKHMITREFNLSWAENMQLDNTLVDGSWWSRADFGKPLLSLEARLAETLRLQVGDVVGFDINGTTIAFTITNLRRVDWDTFNVNFFTVVPPGVLDDKPANWVTSVYLDKERTRHLGRLVQLFPNITLIDIDAIMQRVRGIMDRVSMAVEFVFLFSILAGLAVLYAAIQANQDERRYEHAVLRTLGARKRVLLYGLLAEFTTLGALAGFLAGLSASALAWLLAENIFKFDYRFDISVALTGVLCGVVIVVTAGMTGTRSVLTQPPVKSLREHAA
jgi:putative ABC transport system permease protein